MQGYDNYSTSSKSYATWQTKPSLGKTAIARNEVTSNLALNQLTDHIVRQSGHSLTSAELEVIGQHIKVRCLNRKQLLLQEGDICKYFCFVVKGALKMYSINERGHEAIIGFRLEDEWMTDKESVGSQSPSRFNIEAMEKSQVVLVLASQLYMLSTEIPAIGEMIRVQYRNYAFFEQKRVHIAISMSAEEKYQDLLLYHPEYAERFSQNILAAYLGIKPETLCRIRKR